MGEDEVVESDLTAQQFVHVHFVCVECAEQDLQKKKKKIKINSLIIIIKSINKRELKKRQSKVAPLCTGLT